MCLLVLCGDVEVNPGPTVEEMLESLILGQNKITSEIAALRAQQDDMQKLMSEWALRFAEMEKRAARVDNLEKTIVSLQAKITDLEDRSRRANLVVFGVNEDPAETEPDLKRKVLTEIFGEKLNVHCRSVGRIHRIGKPGTQRPVIIFFQDFNEKEQVLMNANKLKGTKVSIQNDYSKETLRKRKLLWDSAKNEKLQGKKVALVHDKLRVDKEKFAWDDTTNSRIKLGASQNTQFGA